MKQAFVFLILLFAYAASGQGVRVTSAYDSYLYNQIAPVAMHMEPHTRITELPNEAKLFVYAYFDTLLNSRRVQWVGAIYEKRVGFVPIEAISSDQEGYHQIRKLPNQTLSAQEAFNLSQKISVKDSLLAVAQAKEKEVEIEKNLKDLSAVTKRMTAFGMGFFTPDFIEDGNSIHFSFSLYNMRKSHIKYAWITIAIYNPVDDRIATKTITAVGPAVKGKTAEYQFKNVFYTNIFDYGKVTKIKVQWMDGTIKESNTPSTISFSGF